MYEAVVAHGHQGVAVMRRWGSFPIQGKEIFISISSLWCRGKERR